MAVHANTPSTIPAIVDGGSDTLFSFLRSRSFSVLVLTEGGSMNHSINVNQIRDLLTLRRF